MKLLFICTHNRCRSILCESIANHLSEGRITVCSAGSEPAGEVHPLTIRFLQERGFPTEGLRSKSWDELESFDPTVVITVCDSAARETCPAWVGACPKVHWGLQDPSKLKGAEDEIRSAFYAVMDTIEFRVRKLLAMNWENLNTGELQSALQAMAAEN